MSPAALIERLRADPDSLTFAEVLAVIDAHYQYRPTPTRAPAGCWPSPAATA
jgi:hypothetical protein